MLVIAQHRSFHRLGTEQNLRQALKIPEKYATSTQMLFVTLQLGYNRDQGTYRVESC